MAESTQDFHAILLYQKQVAGPRGQRLEEKDGRQEFLCWSLEESSSLQGHKAIPWGTSFLPLE